jgi:hypothetical protein
MMTDLELTQIVGKLIDAFGYSRSKVSADHLLDAAKASREVANDLGIDPSDIARGVQVLRDRVKAAERSADERHAKLVEVADKLRAERTRTDALVASLPKCDEDGCASPATKAFKRGGRRFCDEHAASFSGGVAPDYPRAEPLRAILRNRAGQS